MNKNQQNIKIIVIIIVLLLIGVGVSWFFLRQTNSFKSPRIINKEVNVNSTKTILQKLQLLFSKTTTEKAAVYSYDPQTKKITEIYSFAVLLNQGSPLFDQYNNSSLLAYRVGGDKNEIKRIDIYGEELKEKIVLDFDSFLFSPSHLKVAFNRYNKDINKFSFVIKDMATGKEYSFSSETGLLKPIKWSIDEKYVYTHVVVDGGYAPNLSKIDATTLTISENKIVKDNNLVLLSIDDNEMAYGVDNTKIEFSGKSGPQQIYKVNLKNNTYEIISLKQAQISQLLNVNDQGTLIPYTDLSGNLWILDLVTNIEIPVTSDKIISAKEVFWKDNKMAYTAYDPTDQTILLYIYNVDNKENSLLFITESLATSLDIIGWFAK